MPTKNLGKKRRLERKIVRLSEEIAEIESTIYTDADGDAYNQHFLFQQKRNHAIRGVVLELQLAIEDLLNVWLDSFLLQCKPSVRNKVARRKPKLARTIEQLLEGSGALSFERKLDLAEGTGLIRRSEHTKLRELYRVRNKCSHHWLLDIPVRKRIQRNQPKRRLLDYQNRNLFQIEVLKDFVREYGSMYYKLWLRVYA